MVFIKADHRIPPPLYGMQKGLLIKDRFERRKVMRY
jgi:hypothetical protein